MEDPGARAAAEGLRGGERAAHRLHAEQRADSFSLPLCEGERLEAQLSRCAGGRAGEGTEVEVADDQRLRRRDQEPIPGPVGKGRPGCPS